jgi:hypothetical protein
MLLCATLGVLLVLGVAVCRTAYGLDSGLIAAENVTVTGYTPFMSDPYTGGIVLAMLVIVAACVLVVATVLWRKE